MIKRNAGEVFVDFEKINCWNVDLYEIDNRKECWRNFVWSDQIRKKRSAVKMIIIIKKSINQKKMLTKLYRTESAINFDAYRIIFTHSLSSVMFVFFIIVFWFFLDPEGLMIINFIWWFRYDLFHLTKKKLNGPKWWNRNHNCWSYACMSWNSNDVQLI